ncbi:MAG: T9SS type A sorting domain-containing protein [Chitinophagales bacterium]|nr:T9SS type A sorting domain-containing protein [Chitinophagales bacterium]
MKIIILFFLFTIHYCYSQNPESKRAWHWYFGNGAGIDFSSGTAVADTNGQLYTNEGCATISDLDGNLLFYSDGRTAWNRLHHVMPNGNGLLGGANGSSTQEALIIPKPISPNLYYLFTTDEAENYGANGMRYSVVDMNLDDGNGDVVNNQKNILLFAPCTEKLAAVNHCNDTSVWVIGHEVNNNHFRAYLVTSNGIDTNAVESAIGFPNMNNALGQMNGPIKFSPDGKKLCSVTDTNAKRVELFDFDSYSGTISNRITLSTSTNFNYAVCFSPDNSKLYIGNSCCLLYQYDVGSNDSLTILNSKSLISNLIDHGYRYLSNCSNGKLYVHHTVALDSFISVIDLPNSSGVSCNLNLFSVNLILHSTQAGLPNFNESYFRLSNSLSCITGISQVVNNSIQIFPNPAREWIEIRGSKIKEISIYDVLGNLCYKAADAFTSPMRINVSDFTNGIYVLQLQSAKQNINQKFVKQ